jgi:hypothetical protein
MPRRFLHFPTYRNLQLYHEFVTERRTQVALAQRWRISQCRVSQITRRVKNWVDGLVPPRRFAGEPDKRFHLAVALERIRLREAYDPLVEMFTGPDGQPRLVRKSVTVVGGEARRTVEISEQTDFRLPARPSTCKGVWPSSKPLPTSARWPICPTRSIKRPFTASFLPRSQPANLLLCQVQTRRKKVLRPLEPLLMPS